MSARRISIQCVNCKTVYDVWNSTFYAYKKRNNSSEYVCLSCKNKRRIKPDKKVVRCEVCGKDRLLSRRTNPSGKCLACARLSRVKSVKKVPKVMVKCEVCGKNRFLNSNRCSSCTRLSRVRLSKGFHLSEDQKAKMSASLKHRYKHDKEFRDRQMSYRNDEWRKKLSVAASKNWEDGGYQDKFKSGLMRKYEDKDYAKKISEHMTAINKDPAIIEKRLATLQETLATTDLRDKMSSNTKKLWQTDGFRKSVRDGMMKDDVRERMAKAREKQPRVSSNEVVLSGILNDLGVVFENNKKIAFYHWDFYIPRAGKKVLLIEVQGDYWHTMVPAVVSNDKSKNTYFNRYLSGEYDLRYLWEHEFKCLNKVYDRVKYWVGIAEDVDFDFSSITVDGVGKDECFSFIKAYHYLDPKNGFAVGAKFNGRLIAVALFSPPVRLESAECLKLEYKSTYELSRFCIHPGFNKHNFASWFLARAKKFVYANTDRVAIIAFSDKTVGHDGSIYRADNWVSCGEVPPDYWYVDGDGYHMHKKTLYNHARRMCMKEAEFASKHNYCKVMGFGKLKFVHYKGGSN